MRGGSHSSTLRELDEEAGIPLGETYPEPDAERRMRFWAGNANRVCRVTAWALDIVGEPVPRVDGEEIAEARWFEPREAASLRLGRATRRNLAMTVPGFRVQK